MLVGVTFAPLFLNLPFLPASLPPVPPFYFFCDFKKTKDMGQAVNTG